MKTIVFIGSNKSGSSAEAIKASERMLYYTVLLTDQDAFMDKRSAFPYVHLMKLCDINNINEVRNVINSLIKRGLDIYAIASFVDPYCYTAALLAEEFDLKCFSTEAISIMLNKIKSREILDGTPFKPFFYTINSKDKLTKNVIQEKLPLVLKVPISAGSKDVYKVQTYKQYEEANGEIRNNYPDAPILVEEFLDGPQYLVETVTINEKVNIIAIIEQKITFVGRFIVTGYKMIIDHDNEFYQSLEEAVNSIIKLHGMKDGPCHLEMRYVKNGWKLIEVNPRISGGAMNTFIETAYGINLVKETLRFALGFEPDFEYKYKKETYLQYVIVPREGILIKVTGKNKALNCKAVEHVYIKPKKGTLIIPPISMGYRYAYVIATGKTADEAMENAKYGASQIKFHLREINADILEQLSDTQKGILDTANKNKEYIDSTIPLFNNFILQDEVS